jgi:hypothetical protein
LERIWTSGLHVGICMILDEAPEVTEMT